MYRGRARRPVVVAETHAPRRALGRGTRQCLVTVEAEERIVHENESIYIPIGAVHRLGNPGKIPLELIEVQTGSYLGGGRHRPHGRYLRQGVSRHVVGRDSRL
jgi:hypothetical protein